MNTFELTADAKTILLLCGHFGPGGDESAAAPLLPDEYNLMADWLVGRGLRQGCRCISARAISPLPCCGTGSCPIYRVRPRLATSTVTRSTWPRPRVTSRGTASHASLPGASRNAVAMSYCPPVIDLFVNELS